MPKLRAVLALAALTGGLIFLTTPTASAEVSERIGYINQAGELHIREGAPDADDVFQAANVKSFQLEVDRVMALTDEGELLVKEGDLGPGWETIDTGVLSAELDGDRIGYQKADGIYVQVGDIYGDATKVYDGAVQKWQIEVDRVAVLVLNGTSRELRVKDDQHDWTTVTTYAANFTLHADRIAYTVPLHHGDHFLFMNEGAITEPFQRLTSGVWKLQLSGDRTAVFASHSGGRGVFVYDGDTSGNPKLVASTADQRFFLCADRIVSVKDGNLSVIEGDLTAPPQPAGSIGPNSELEVDGDRIAESSPTDGLRVKAGDPGSDWVTISQEPVKAFQLGADAHPPIDRSL